MKQRKKSAIFEKNFLNPTIFTKLINNTCFGQNQKFILSFSGSYKIKAIINIKNKDQKYFIWRVLASLYPKNSSSSHFDVNKYNKYEDKWFSF